MFRTQVRPARPADARALHDLVAGLSRDASYRRFFVGVGAPSPRTVSALLRRDGTHGAWVCVSAEQVVGHAIWGVDDGAAELGVVVADAWQHRGIGRSLAAAAAAEARSRGLTEVRMHVHSENRGLARRLSNGAAGTVLADGMVTVTRPLADLITDRSPAPAAVGVAPRAGDAGQVLKVFWARSRPWLTSASTASAARSIS